MACYVEVKWSSIDRQQLVEYKSLLDDVYPAGGYRLIWLIPSDLRPQFDRHSVAGVEVVEYDRDKMARLAEQRGACQKLLTYVVNRIQEQVEVTIRSEKVRFNTVVHACYFGGTVETDKGVRGVGLRKQGPGRYLDLVLGVASSPWAELLPEATTKLIDDLFNAPYFYGSRTGGSVHLRGFRHHVLVSCQGSQRGFWQPIGHVVLPLAKAIEEHLADQWDHIRSCYPTPDEELDVLWRMLNSIVAQHGGNSTLTVRQLVDALVQGLALAPTPPPTSIKHVGLQQTVMNNVSVEGYESDMAKRLVELCALKRTLTPVAGYAQMWVLTPIKRGGEWTVKRSQCQTLRFNPDTSAHLQLKMWRQNNDD